MEGVFNDKRIAQSFASLTPKGPDCYFWHYNSFGHVPMSGDLVYFGPNFNRRCG